MVKKIKKSWFTWGNWVKGFWAGILIALATTAFTFVGDFVIRITNYMFNIVFLILYIIFFPVFYSLIIKWVYGIN